MRNKEEGKNIVIILPSYNASYNIIKVIDKILYLLPKAKIIVVDDNSPDKTHELITSRYHKIRRLKLIIRKNKGGRGSAVIRGFKEGLKNKKNKYFIEMDADFSHDPKYIPKLIKVCQSKDIAIASKNLKQSKIIGLPFHRKLLSTLANYVFKVVLQIPISDYTDGFRCYKRHALESIRLNNVTSKGFIVLSEIAYILYKKGFTFGEIPITLRYYKQAGSNFNLKEVSEGVKTILRLYEN